MASSKTRLASRMRALRAHFGVSLRALQARSGIPATTMASWERGTVETVNGSNAAALGRALGLEPSIVLAYLYDENPPSLPNELPIEARQEEPDPDIALFYEGWQNLSEQEKQSVTKLMLRASLRRQQDEGNA